MQIVLKGHAQACPFVLGLLENPIDTVKTIKESESPIETGRKFREVLH